MSTINQLLRRKGNKVLSIGPDETVYAALELMAQTDVGALLVMFDDGLLGILSERDYAREVVLKGRTSPDTLVRDIMQAQVICVTPDETVEACMELVTEERVRYLAVMSHDSVVGIVSIGDLVKSVIDDQRFTIEQLEDYIHGEPRHH